MYSAIILSGGESKRFGGDKGLFRVGQKPLLYYVVKSVAPLVDEVLIIIRCNDKKYEYSHQFPFSQILIDEDILKAPVSGALTGFKNAIGDYSILLPCDTPLVSQKVLSFLLSLVEGFDCVVPRWPSSYIEPLQAVYLTKTAYEAARKSIEEGKNHFRDMISHLKKVLYVSTIEIKKLDTRMLTFRNINTLEDLKSIKKYLRNR